MLMLVYGITRNWKGLRILGLFETNFGQGLARRPTRPYLVPPSASETRGTQAFDPLRAITARCLSCANPLYETHRQAHKQVRAKLGLE